MGALGCLCRMLLQCWLSLRRVFIPFYSVTVCLRAAQWRNSNYTTSLLWYLYIRNASFIWLVCYNSVHVSHGWWFLPFTFPPPVIWQGASLWSPCWEDSCFLTSALSHRPCIYSASLWLRSLARRTERKALHSKVKGHRAIIKWKGWRSVLNEIINTCIQMQSVVDPRQIYKLVDIQ